MNISFNPTNSTQSFQSIEKTESSQKLSQWSEKYFKGFFSHAVWQTNASEVLSLGGLRSAELRVRLGEKVEYEKESDGGRGTTKGIILDAVDFQRMADHLLTEEEKSRFEDLSKRAVTLKAKYKRLKGLQKEIIDLDPFKWKDPVIDKQREEVEGLINDPDIKDYILYKELKNKKVRRFFGFKRRYLLADWGFVFEFNRWKLSVNTKVPKELTNIIEELTQKHQCSEMELFIAFDECLKDDKIDCYLFKKYQKGCPLDDLQRARDYTLRHVKLNSDIRMMENKILWHYGPIAVLKGYGSDEERIKFIQDEKVQNIGEHRTLPPWANNGKFSIIAFKDPDILILGPKSILKEHAKTYSNLVYIEDLTIEQKQKFGIKMGP